AALDLLGRADARAYHYERLTEHLRGHDWSAALGDSGALIALAPDRVERSRLLAERGAVLGRLGRWAESVADFERALPAVAADPPRPACRLLQRGDGYPHPGRPDRAAADFAAALDLSPGDNWDWYRAAVLWAWIGDRDGYRRHCRRMLDRYGTSA